MYEVVDPCESCDLSNFKSFFLLIYNAFERVPVKYLLNSLVNPLHTLTFATRLKRTDLFAWIGAMGFLKHSRKGKRIQNEQITFHNQACERGYRTA
jgi:hypothetical protein